MITDEEQCIIHGLYILMTIRTVSYLKNNLHNKITAKCYPEPKPNWGEGWDWDFSIPYENVLTWPTNEDFTLKVDSIYSFFPDGEDWGYQALKYYYTKIETDSVRTIGTDNGTLRLEGRVLTAADTSAAIEVYDMTGRRVAAGLGTADLSNLQAGIYVATAVGDTLKFILR